MLSSPPPPSYSARCRASPCKRLRIQLDHRRDVDACQRTRRVVIAVPFTFNLVTDLASYLQERFASKDVLQAPLRLSVDGYALPAEQPLRDLIRENDVLIIRESAGGMQCAVQSESAISTPIAKRCRINDIDTKIGSIEHHGCSKEKVDSVALISSAEAVARARNQLAARHGHATSGNNHDLDETEAKAAALKAAKAAALAEATAALVIATSEKADFAKDTHVEQDFAKAVSCEEQPEKENGRQETCQEVTQLSQESKEFRVFVGGLPWACTEDVLHKDFSECGKILDLKIMEDKETGRSRGFAFINFADEAGLQAALKFDGDEYGGRTLKVSRTEAKGKSKGKGKRNK